MYSLSNISTFSFFDVLQLPSTMKFLFPTIIFLNLKITLYDQIAISASYLFVFICGSFIEQTVFYHFIRELFLLNFSFLVYGFSFIVLQYFSKFKWFIPIAFYILLIFIALCFEELTVSFFLFNLFILIKLTISLITKVNFDNYRSLSSIKLFLLKDFVFIILIAKVTQLLDLMIACISHRFPTDDFFHFLLSYSEL